MARCGPDNDSRFRDRYLVSGAEALLAAEAEALGSDYQANGYTTITQADDLGLALRLAPGQLLVDLGAGCGWPGLYLASRHGCSVLSIDPVAEGAEVARERVVADALTTRAWSLRAVADALPLRPGSADAVAHTDLLC